MKGKIFTILVISLLVFSSLNLALAKVVQCPTCGGTGSIACPSCDGTGVAASASGGSPCSHCSGTGTLTPTLQRRSMTAEQNGVSTIITATFNNPENVEVKGTVTATLAGYTATSPETTFPPNQDTPVTSRLIMWEATLRCSCCRLYLFRRLRLTSVVPTAAEQEPSPRRIPAPNAEEAER